MNWLLFHVSVSANDMCKTKLQPKTLIHFLATYMYIWTDFKHTDNDFRELILFTSVYMAKCQSHKNLNRFFLIKQHTLVILFHYKKFLTST